MIKAAVGATITATSPNGILHRRGFVFLLYSAVAGYKNGVLLVLIRYLLTDGTRPGERRSGRSVGRSVAAAAYRLTHPCQGHGYIISESMFLPALSTYLLFLFLAVSPSLKLSTVCPLHTAHRFVLRRPLKGGGQPCQWRICIL